MNAAGPGTRLAVPVRSARAEVPARSARAAYAALMRRLCGASLPLTAAVLALAPGAAAQDREPVPVRTRVDSLRSDLLDPFPEDTSLDTVVAGDTVPEIDIAERREALSAGGFPDRDELFQELASRPGWRAIEYRGEQVRLRVPEERIRLTGEAQVNYRQDVLTADTIRYLGAERFLAARSGIELVGADGKQVVTDDSLYYDVSGLKGTVFGARTDFAARGANWYVTGNAIPVAQDTVYVTEGRFTSCELEEPHYYFQAGQIKMVAQNVIVAWPVVLYVQDVPIFWLPFFAQDIRPGRHSGILPPRFGFNDVVRTSGGYSRQVSDFGYYWAINEYMDAQATVDWFSGNYTRVNGAFRYHFMKDFIRGSVLARRSWGDRGRNFGFDIAHDQSLGLHTQLRANAHYVQNTQLLEDRSFDPRTPTRIISSDVGLEHRLSFGSLSASASRQQFLGPNARTDLVLPSVNFNFSPLTLLAEPAGRESFLGDVTWHGSVDFSRRTRSVEGESDQTTTDVSAQSGFSLMDGLTLSSSARLQDFDLPAVDSLGVPLPDSASRTVLNWNSSAAYQIDLFGSTSLSPNVNIAGASFRSNATGGDVVSAPVRTTLGATLRTDVYGFFPGFGPFTRIRHRFSPSFTYGYAPDVRLDPALEDIPFFPLASGQARNTLNISLRQTFEAKVRVEEPETEPERRGPADSLRAVRDTVVVTPAGDTVAVSPAGDTVGFAGAADTAAAIEAAPGREAPPRAGAQAADTLEFAPRTDAEQTITLLSITTSGIQFDFERAKRGEPVLVTEQLTNSLTSDLLRGVDISLRHDLFEGTGATRRFDPFLSAVTANFTLQSGEGLGGVFGLTRGGAAGRAEMPEPELDSTEGLGEFRTVSETLEREPAGPWSLRVRYSLIRARPGDAGRESQSVDGFLSFNPTPNWSVRWSTQYNLSEGEFGRHLLSLDRELHRWHASFQFARSPNGNFLFQVLVNLTDAPELKVDYDQRSEPGE